jgi:peptidyl-dipeptidase A
MVSVKNLGVLVLVCAIGYASTYKIDTKPSLTPEEEAAIYLREITPDIEEQYKLAYEFSFEFTDDEDDEESALGQFLFIFIMGAQFKMFFTELNQKLKSYPIETFENKDLARQIKLLIDYDYSVLGDDKEEQMLDITTKFEDIITSVKFCTFEDHDECELTYKDWKQKILKATELDEIRYYWKEWRTKAGEPFRNDFKEFAELYKDAATENKFTKPSGMWFYEYEDDNVFAEIGEALEEMKPLYQELHAYVRHFLQTKFGAENVVSTEGIPDDLLEKYIVEASSPDGSIGYPYPDKQIFNMRKELVDKDYTADKFTHKADEFFQSMHMHEMPKGFYDNRVQLKSNSSTCFPSAVGYWTKDDVGLRYCNDVTFRNYLAVHREMTEIQYHLNSQDLPLAFRKVVWPGFTQAVAYAVLASVASPAHLKSQGFLEDFTLDDETNLNRLYRVAIQILFKMPMNYVQDKFRIDVLNSDIDSEEYNCEFWKMQEKYVGVRPPVVRTEKDFDALAKVLHGVDTMRTKQIFSKFVGFQFYESLCNKAGHTGRLDNCDFSGDNAAATALKDMMALGASKHWREVMKTVTDTDKIGASSLLKYFEPLQNWLHAENIKNNAQIGGTSTTNRDCKSKDDTE